MQYVQWFGIEVLYANEWAALPAAVLLLHSTHKAKSFAGRTAHWLIYAAVAFYLISFHMHRYSLWAWPVFLAMFVYHRIRANWPWVISFQLHDLQPWLVSRPLWQTIGAGLLILVIPVYSWLAAIPWWFLGLLLIVAGAIFGVLKILAWLRGGENGFLAYLDRDPRMSTYFDWIRRLQGVSSSAPSLLAENRLTTHRDLLGDEFNSLQPRWDFWNPGFWLSGMWLFGLHGVPGVSFLARCYWRQRCHWLNSTFVSDSLENARQRAWCDYEVARWGTKIDDYLEAVRNERHLPAELSSDAHERRLRWLVATEAMAEYYTLAIPSKTLHVKGQPNLLRAADLLGTAGQLQLEIAWDLERASSPDQAAQQRCLAWRFYDLAALCLESYLDESISAPNKPESLDARAERFLKPLEDDDWWKQNETVDPNAAEDSQARSERADLSSMKSQIEWADFYGRESKLCHVRLALAWHYLLVAELSAGSADATQRDVCIHWFKTRGNDLFKLLLSQLKKHSLPEGGGRPQALILHAAAEVTYLLERQDAVTARQVFGKQIAGDGEIDHLVHLADTLQTLGQWQQIEPPRIWMLQGMIQEASMAGTVGDTRQMRLTNAADAYVRAESLRVWRLHALQLRDRNTELRKTP